MDSGIEYEVTNGLAEGERLIVQGGSQLTDGAKVNVIQ